MRICLWTRLWFAERVGVGLKHPLGFEKLQRLRTRLLAWLLWYDGSKLLPPRLVNVVWVCMVGTAPVSSFFKPNKFSNTWIELPPFWERKNESGFNFFYFVYALLAISKIRWIKSGDETLKSNRYEVQNCWWKIEENIFNWSPSFISNGNIATGNVSSTGCNWARGGWGLSLCEMHAVDKVTLLQLSVKRF